jgi:hypothetical protein
MGVSSEHVNDATELRLRKRLTASFWALVILLGAVESWIGRAAMNTDGISYLDVASAFSRHEWAVGVNAYWSPLYPFLLGIALRILKPSSYGEFPVLHLVNFLIFLASAAAFQFALSRLIYFRRKRAVIPNRQPYVLPEWSLFALGYALFLWISLQLMPISVVSPDMTVALFVYLAAGIVLGMGAGLNRVQDFVLLAIVLGFGYLAKAPMLPVGIVFLAMACFLAGGIRKALVRIPLAVVAMMLVASPFVVMLSHIQGRPTWGDSANLNYVWYVNDLPRYHWQGGPLPGNGKPIHPTNRLSQDPPVYGFNGNGTYAVWYDPAYWNQGARPVLELKSIMRQIFENLLLYEKVILHEQAAVLVICLLLFLIGGRAKLAFQSVREYWMLLLPIAATLGMYSLVHVEERMIAPFLLLLWLALFAAVRFPGTYDPGRLAPLSVVALVIFVVGMQGASVFGEMASHSPRELLSWKNPSSNFEWQVAQELCRAGVQPGDKVAWIRPALFSEKQNYSWANLSRVKIVAEVPTGEEDRFWQATPEKRQQAFDAIAQTGAVAFVATSMPAGYPKSDWKPLGATGYWAYLLQPTER